MLRYRIIKQKNALDKDKSEMYYPRLTGRQKYNVRDVAEVISSRTSLSKADILATLISLEDVIPELLKMGSTLIIIGQTKMKVLNQRFCLSEITCIIQM